MDPVSEALALARSVYEAHREKANEKRRLRARSYYDFLKAVQSVGAALEEVIREMGPTPTTADFLKHRSENAVILARGELFACRHKDEWSLYASDQGKEAADHVCAALNEDPALTATGGIELEALLESEILMSSNIRLDSIRGQFESARAAFLEVVKREL